MTATFVANPRRRNGYTLSERLYDTLARWIGPVSAPLFGNPSEVSVAEKTIVTRTVTVSSIGTRDRMLQAMSRIDHLARLPVDWDSYGAPRIHPAAIHKAVALVELVAESDFEMPHIVPTSTGGVQLEWHWTYADLEIELTAGSAIDAFIEVHGVGSWEGDLVNAFERFAAFVADLRAQATHVVTAD